MSPATPGPIRQGVDDSRPVANAVFLVQQADRTVTSFTTDKDGRFEVSLPPGHYSAIKQGARRHGPGHFGPFEVEVQAGQVTNVQWKCDTGMD